MRVTALAATAATAALIAGSLGLAGCSDSPTDPTAPSWEDDAELDLDRVLAPFAYVPRDRRTGTVLFTGRVTAP